jgi:hypothetical protein
MEDDRKCLKGLQLLLEDTSHVITVAHVDGSAIYADGQLLLNSVSQERGLSERTAKRQWSVLYAKAVTKEFQGEFAALGVGSLFITKSGHGGRVIVRPCLAVYMMLWADTTLELKWDAIAIGPLEGAVGADDLVDKLTREMADTSLKNGVDVLGKGILEVFENDLKCLQALQRLLEGTEHTLIWYTDATHIRINANVLLASTVMETWKRFEKNPSSRKLRETLESMGMVGMVQTKRGHGGGATVRPYLAIKMMVMAEPVLRLKYLNLGFATQIVE